MLTKVRPYRATIIITIIAFVCLWIAFYGFSFSIKTNGDFCYSGLNGFLTPSTLSENGAESIGAYLTGDTVDNNTGVRLGLRQRISHWKKTMSTEARSCIYRQKYGNDIGLDYSIDVRSYDANDDNSYVYQSGENASFVVSTRRIIGEKSGEGGFSSLDIQWSEIDGQIGNASDFTIIHSLEIIEINASGNIVSEQTFLQQ